MHDLTPAGHIMSYKTKTLSFGELKRRQLLRGALAALSTNLLRFEGIAPQAAQAVSSTPTIVFDPAFQVWTLRNEVFQAVLRMNRTNGALQLDEMRNLATNEVWRLAFQGESFPVTVDLEMADGLRVGSSRTFSVVGQEVVHLERGGLGLALELLDDAGVLGMLLRFDIYPGQPVLRHQAKITNRLARPIQVRKADFLAWEFSGEMAQFDAFGVHQWVLVPREANFEPVEMPLASNGPGMVLATGSGGTHCAWLAVKDRKQRGLFAGLEFNGRAEFAVRHANDRVTWSAQVMKLDHPLPAGGSMTLPPAFVGVFHGDWDEAGYRTQQYLEAAIAPPLPDNDFPYIAWDSWGYRQEINEDLLRANARIAADLGMELFVVDLGWARSLGDWEADPVKFPSGLRALSDYVHDLGMKFGLHFAFSEAAPESRMLQSNEDWTSSENYHFHGGESICLGHHPAREWIIEQGVAMINRYRVDWVLQDGQTLVKECTKTTHTHLPRNSNWANSEDGLDIIVSEITRRTGVVWENCANGGSMMTFKMARNYVTSITNDASGSLGSRQGAFGATYPFSPRFADRYMPDQQLDEYTTRSFMFGGPWIFMNRLEQLSPESLDLAKREIATYKLIRPLIRSGRVAHLTGRPAAGNIDAIQSYHAGRDEAVVIVVREDAPSDQFVLKCRDLTPSQSYLVSFETARAVYAMTGAQLMGVGVPVPLPSRRAAEIVYIEPANRPAGLSSFRVARR